MKGVFPVVSPNIKGSIFVNVGGRCHFFLPSWIVTDLKGSEVAV